MGYRATICTAIEYNSKVKNPTMSIVWRIKKDFIERNENFLINDFNLEEEDGYDFFIFRSEEKIPEKYKAYAELISFKVVIQFENYEEFLYDRDFYVVHIKHRACPAFKGDPLRPLDNEKWIALLKESNKFDEQFILADNELVYFD